MNPLNRLFQRISKRRAHARAVSLANEGLNFYRRGQTQSALLTFHQILTIIHESEGSGNEVTTLNKVFRDILSMHDVLGGNRGRTLSIMGEIYHELGFNIEAKQYITDALKVLRAARDHAGEIRTLLNMAIVCEALEQLDEALRHYTYALSLTRETAGLNAFFGGEDNSLPRQATILNNIGGLHQSLGQYPEALRSYGEALVIWRKVEDRVSEATTLTVIGGTHHTLKQYQEALRYFSDALTIWRKVNDQDKEAKVLQHIGVLYQELSSFKEAQQYYNEALTITRELNNRIGEAALLNNIGLVYRNCGQYEQALRYYNDVLPIVRESLDRAREASTLNNLGAVYEDLERPLEALRYCEDALAIAQELGDRANVATMLNNLGILCHKLGRHDQALQYYTHSLVILGELGNRTREEGRTLNNIGVEYRVLGLHQEALEHFTNALTILHQAEDKVEQGTVLHNIGEVHHSLKQYDEAIRHFTDAIEIARNVGDRVGEGKTLGNLGVVYRDTGDYLEACRCFESSCTIFEKIRAEVLSDSSRATFFTSAQEVFQNYIDVLMCQHRKEAKNDSAIQAFHICERGRSRALLDLIAKSPTNVLQVQDASLAGQRAELLAALALAQNRLTGEVLTEQEQKQWLAQRDRRELELEQLEAKIHRLSPDHNQVYLTALNLSQIQELLLDEKTVLLQFALGTETGFLWAVSKHAWQAYSLPRTAEIRKYLEMCIGTFFGHSGDYRHAAHELYRMLVEPAEKFISDNLSRNENGAPGTLIIVPDDDLCLLPFELLLTQPAQAINDYSQLSYLLNRYSIVYAPSATVLATVKSKRAVTVKKTWEKDFIGFAPVEFLSAKYLPETESEIRGIAGLFPTDKAAIKLREEASKRAVQSAELKLYRYVHYATHGQADISKPQFCGILFRDAEEDAMLNTFEIFSLELDADMVTLSACQSGLGKMITGEGIMGLTRAFFYSGASSVCVSLWAVADESTSRLMQDFYRHLIEDKLDKAHALRRAKLNMIQEGLWADPFHWSPFVLVGSWC